MADLSAEISAIIDEQRNYAQDAVSAAMSAASRAVGGFTPNPIATTTIRNTAPVPGSIGVPPQFTANYVPPVNTADLDSLQPLYIPTLPDINDAPTPIDTSNLFQQDAPDYTIQPFTETAPDVDTDIDIPDAPDIEYPDAPTITYLDLPDAPDITIPDYDPVNVTAQDPGTLDDVTARAKEVYETALPEMRWFISNVVDDWILKYAPEYHNAMVKLENKIAAGIDGGTALSDGVEQQIFDRSRARVEAERQRAEQDLLQGMSKRGYSLPPSAVSAGLNRIQQAASENVSRAASETAIRRAELEIEHCQFIMNLSTTLHQGMLNTAIQYASQLVAVNGQALQYSQQIADTMIREYNARVERYTAELQLAQIETAIYETKLKAALADIEIFQVKIRAAELQKNVERINVDIYKAKIEAENAKIETYLAELQGVATEANLRKLSVEIYGQQVNAYVAQVKAKEAEFGVYESALRGDEAKVRAYAAQVRAYSEEVSAQKSIADIEIAHSEAINQYNRNIIEEYKAELAGFGAELDAAKTKFSADVEGYRGQLEAYKTKVLSTLETYNTKYKHAALDVDAAKATLDAYIQSEISLREIAQRGIAAGGSTAVGVANAMASLAGSAASATNTIVNLAQESTG